MTPRFARCRAATDPSPPLPSDSDSTTTERGENRSMMSCARLKTGVLRHLDQFDTPILHHDAGDVDHLLSELAGLVRPQARVSGHRWRAHTALTSGYTGVQ